MKYPTQIYIQGRHYTIEYVETGQEVDADFVDNLMLGQVDNKTIRVRVGQQPPLEILDTLIHEIIHVIFSHNRMLGSTFESAKMEESFIFTMASELACVLFNSGVGDFTEPPPITTRICKGGNED